MIIIGTLSFKLPAPIRFNTSDITGSAAYDNKTFGVFVSYTDSSFSNDVNALYWDNPRRLNDVVSTGGVIGGASKGFLDFYPDNDAHFLTLQAHANLPGNTVIYGNGTWGTMTQNQSFLPFSVNSELVDSNSGLHATDPALLPVSSLNGKVKTTAYTVDAVSKPIKQLTFHARYESYDYNNKTDQLIFPGTATYGDSYWATNWGESYREPSKFL